MSMMDSVKRAGFRAMYGYLDKDPDANIPRLMDWVDRFTGNGPNSFPVQRAAFRRVIEDPDNNWYRLIHSMWTDIDDEVRKTFFENFMINGNLIGWAVQEEARERCLLRVRRRHLYVFDTDGSRAPVTPELLDRLAALPREEVQP